MDDSRKSDFVRNSSDRARSRSSDGSGVLPNRAYNGSKKVKEDEVDFYDSPTTLSRLILHQKYEAAMRRLEKAPYEASTWVSAIRAPDIDDDQTMKTSITINSSAQFSFRQMPLHMVCGELARVKDSVLREQVEQLIGKLVTIYPDAAKKRDHDNKLPLHEALWYNATPQTISILMMAYPEAADEVDMFGRTALQVIQHRRGGNEDHKEAIEKMLLRGYSFWNLARKEKNLKMKHGRVSSSGASVDSQSVLNDSQAGNDDYTIATRESAVAARAGRECDKHFRYGTKVANPHAKKKKTPVAWDQLEHRAQKLEHMLAEHNEENFRMAEEISRLKKIEAKYEKLTSSEVVAQQVIQLEKENAELTKTVIELRRILQRNDITDEEMTQYTKPLEIVVDKMSSSMSVAESVSRSLKSRDNSHRSSLGNSHEVKDDNKSSGSKIPTSVFLGDTHSISRKKTETRSGSRGSFRDDASTLSGDSKRSGEWSDSGSEASPVRKVDAKTGSKSSSMQLTSSHLRISPHRESKYVDPNNRKFNSGSTRPSLSGAPVQETPLSSTLCVPIKPGPSTPAFIKDDSSAYSSLSRCSKPRKADTRSLRIEQQIQSLKRGTDAFDSMTLCTDSLEVIPETAIMIPSKESAEVARLRKERENLQSLVKDLVRDLNKKRVKRQTQKKGTEGGVEVNGGVDKNGFDAYRSSLTKSPSKSKPTVEAMKDKLKVYESSLQRDNDSISQRSNSSSALKVLNSF